MMVRKMMVNDLKKVGRVRKNVYICSMKVKNEEIGRRPTLCSDGKYRWTYEVNLFKNPTVLFDVYKMLGITVGITALLMLLIVACADGFSLKALHFSWQVMLLMGAIFMVLGALGYVVYALMVGRKYIVQFTMDEEHLEHRQLSQQAERGKKLGLIGAMLGGMAGGRGAANASMMAALRGNTMTSTFSNVRKVVPRRWMHTIKVNEPFGKNRVFVADEDFDFVLQFLRDHCPRATRRS